MLRLFERDDRELLRRALHSSQERLQWLAHYDSLTGLANRKLFFDRLQQASDAASRGGPSFALFLIELDLLKEVNDMLGHSAGDRVLTEIGRRLQRLARATDSYGRIGSDGFAAILPGMHSHAGARTAAETLCEVIKAPIHIGSKSVTLGASIGVALAPLHGATSREILAQADRAMSKAKCGSRGYEIASSRAREMDEISAVAIASDIGAALERKELFLQYQPKVSLRSGRLAGVEALARWNKPGSGLIAPGQFIPAIERSAAIVPVTFALLDMALDQMKAWRDQGWRIPVSVNLSARMLDDHSLTARIAAALERRRLDPKLLTLEMTETSLMHDPPRAKRVVAGLAAAGLSISIDDFGSGYNSLLLLRELDIHEIKLDKAFVDGLGCASRDESIIRCVATLSSGFAIDLVAEGIEERDSLARLQSLGCDLGQGYCIARPMAADDLAAWWRDWQANGKPCFTA
ncbi:MAG: putative bifunctional diguanylate cyclase/phosphodiesterase [Kiloniellales bacterium]